MAKDHISFDGQVFSTKKEMNNHETNFTRHRLITHYMDPTSSLKMNKNTYLQDLVNQIRNLSETNKNVVIEILNEIAQKSHQKKYAQLRETLITENNANGVKSFVNVLKTHLKTSVNWQYKMSPNAFYNSNY